MISGNVLTLSSDYEDVVNCRAIYGTVTENIYSLLTNYNHVQTLAESKNIPSGGDPDNLDAYTPGEGAAQWASIVPAWKAMTLAGATTSGGQRALKYQVGSKNTTTGKYMLNSRLWAGISLWDTTNIVGQKVFQVRANMDTMQTAGLIYFATYMNASGKPATTLATVHANAQPYIMGWNWYDLDPVLTMGDRLLVACVPSDLDFEGVGTFWNVQKYVGILNPDSYRTRYYVEPA